VIKIKQKNEAIGCTVDHCKHYDKKHCTLDKINVAKCDAVDDDTTKDATMCDSYDMQ